VIGLSDGLTVPFALAAGLTSAFPDSHTVVLGVVAELVAGAISMGVGGYLSGRTEVMHYDRERRLEAWEIRNHVQHEIEETWDFLRPLGLPDESISVIVKHFQENPVRVGRVTMYRRRALK